MKKIFITIVFLLIGYQIGFAQKRDLTYFNYKGKDLINFLITRTSYPKNLAINCIMPFTYIKFKVNDQNQVDSVFLTNKKFPELEKEVIKNLKQTTGYWNLQAINNRWLVIPMMHFIINSKLPNKNCNFEASLIEQQKQSETLYMLDNNIYFPILAITIHASNVEIP